MATQEVLIMMEAFLEGKIEAEDFSFTFPDVLVEQWDEIEKENQQLVHLLNEDMPDLCANFEPDQQACSQRAEYLNEEQFKKCVNAVYKKALKLVN
ncbi:hypothetical protein [Lysinibacillus piscis]|uniref:Uncharacterized protein n=1 Tax=Lysinibacillus piscis TaxID=2518931 RepID=A0ABQ5NHG0_9BACI|nr:hypothetical protein [Lysinibacillus sp. KH24]GLC87501.1 hypothetical protein LYSBPC_06280 [Lysinibacillus sp. KH24]